jgi:hypothetical protein
VHPINRGGNAGSNGIEFCLYLKPCRTPQHTLYSHLSTFEKQAGTSLRLCCNVVAFGRGQKYTMPHKNIAVRA